MVRARVQVIAGDLTEMPALPDGIDVVVHSASNVSFDPPIDEAFQANVGGPMALYRALLAADADPHVIHVSTGYVAGLRRGVAEERSVEHDVDYRIELDQAVTARAGAEELSRTPDVLDALQRTAHRAHRRAGHRTVGSAVEKARADWVKTRLADQGRARARSLGWADVYTLTKVLGERVAEEQWAASGHRLSVVRPTIIESALRHPFPGWIDGFKVADPLIAAYGRGLLPEFPALADTILDVIPVDFVVNAILAVMAAPPKPKETEYFQVSTGMSNPLRFRVLAELAGAYFSEHPPQDSVSPVSRWTFPHPSAVERSARRREGAVKAAGALVAQLPATPHTRRWNAALHKAGRDLGLLRRMMAIYQPYTRIETIFDDTRLRVLHAALPAEVRAERGFDVTEIDWRHYLLDVHIPNMPAMPSRARSGTAAVSPDELPRRADVLAVFDLQRTVALTSLVEQYLWVELARRPVQRWPAAVATLAARSTHYLRAERADRADFIRSFMRRYAGCTEDELRTLVTEAIAPSLRRGLLVQAVNQIEAHRQAGHRTVLVTGQIDLFVEPLAPLFDEIVAGSMDTDELGRWTGHLAAHPVVGDARAMWLQRYARQHDMDLSASYAYGDSYADRPWLETVGFPNAVNPDLQLHLHAKRSGWPTHAWSESVEGRVAPVLRSMLVGARHT